MTNTETRVIPTKRSISELAKEAFRIQDACNLCGLAQGFARAMVDLQDFAFSTKTIRLKGTQEVTEGDARKFIIKAWIDKLADLSSYKVTDNLNDLHIVRLVMESGE